MGSGQTGFSAIRAKVPGSAGNKRRKWIGVAAAIGILAVIGLAAGVTWAVRRGSDQGTGAPAASGQPVPELSGRQAPAFTLLSATGVPYSFAPGDGKKHLFVFFMGYF